MLFSHFSEGTRTPEYVSLFYGLRIVGLPGEAVDLSLTRQRCLHVSSSVQVGGLWFWPE